MDKVLKILTNQKFITSLIIIGVGIVLYLIIRNVIIKYFNQKRANTKLEKRRLTYYRLISSILKYLIIIIVILLVLQVNGFNVASLLTGLGVVSLVAGLALQDALKDIIMGFNLIVDEFFSVGDVVKIGDVEGIVIELGLKATKIKDIRYGNTLVIANRNINSAITISNHTDIDINLPYEEKMEKMEKVINEIVDQAKELKNVNNVRYVGLNKFDDSYITYKIAFDTKPEERFQAKRDINKIIKETLDKKKISIPYQQIDIHAKK